MDQSSEVDRLNPWLSPLAFLVVFMQPCQARETRNPVGKHGQDRGVCTGGKSSSATGRDEAVGAK